MAFITLALQLVWPVEAMGYIIASGQEAATAAQRVLEIFDTEPEITDKNSPERAGVHALAPGRGPRLAVHGCSPPAGHLVFDHVGFRYPGADRDVLHGVTLDLAPGETVALVGATGSGKTTLTAADPPAVRRDRPAR